MILLLMQTIMSAYYICLCDNDGVCWTYVAGHMYTYHTYAYIEVYIKLGSCWFSCNKCHMPRLLIDLIGCPNEVRRLHMLAINRTWTVVFRVQPKPLESIFKNLSTRSYVECQWNWGPSGLDTLLERNSVTLVRLCKRLSVQVPTGRSKGAPSNIQSIPRSRTMIGRPVFPKRIRVWVSSGECLWCRQHSFCCFSATENGVGLIAPQTKSSTQDCRTQSQSYASDQLPVP